MKDFKHLSQDKTLKISRLHNIFNFNGPNFFRESNTTVELDSSEGFEY